MFYTLSASSEAFAALRDRCSACNGRRYTCSFARVRRVYHGSPGAGGGGEGGSEDSELPPFFGVVIARARMRGYREGKKKRYMRNDDDDRVSDFGPYSRRMRVLFPAAITEKSFYI